MERALYIPTGALCPVLRMEFLADREVLIEGVRRIVQYDEHRIRLQTVDGVLTFEGDGMQVDCLTCEKARILGRILSLSFGE